MKLSLAALAVAATLAVSCRSKQPDTVIIDRDSPPNQPSTIVIEKDHVHGAGCGHYYYNGRWYAEAEHVHIVD